jgi:hypothetical protein
LLFAFLGNGQTLGDVSPLAELIIAILLPMAAGCAITAT